MGVSGDPGAARGLAPDVRARLEARAPSDALTVGEAAALVGASPASLRRRIQSGRLLHETGRRSGRHVTLVRVVDLLAEYGGPTAPPARGTSRATGSAHGPEAQPVGDPVGVPPEGAPQDAGREEQLLDQVQTLEHSRDRLQERCADLDSRISLLMEDRQAGGAGLLVTQRRLLELESAIVPPVVWWRCPRTWGLAATALVLGGLWRGAFADRNEVVGQLTQVVTENEEERSRLEGELGSLRQTAAADRTLYGERIEAARAAAEAMEGTLKQDRLALEVDRQRWAGAMEEARAALRARDAEWRGERERSEQDRARHRTEILQREADLRVERERRSAEDQQRRDREEAAAARQRSLVDRLEEQLAAARVVSDDLRGELDQTRVRQEQYGVALESGLGRLETLAAEAARAVEMVQETQARSEAESQARLQTQALVLGWFLRAWGLRPEAKASDPRGGATGGSAGGVEGS